MKTIEIVVGAIFVVMIFWGMLFVPSFAMGEDNTMEKWMQDHTVKVNATTTCTYEQGYLHIKEVYTGEVLKERFGVEQITKELKIPVEGMVVKMQEGEEETFVTEKVTVLTSADDPPHWWDNYEYPQWTWSESGGIYEKEDPINLAWKNTTKGVVKSEILDEGWYDYGTWYGFYVYDPVNGWVYNDNVADDPFGLFGRYHARLWQMSDGNVIANAHHDTSVPHEAEKLEEAEELVASYFNEPDDTEWQIYEDSYYLNNAVITLDNNGWCTQIDHNPMMGPTIVSYTISNRMITPPQTTEIDVAFSERVSYRIAIENATGTVYDWTGKAKNPNAKVWNGAYESDGTAVPAGDYTVNVTGTNTTTGSYVTNNTGIITVASGGDDVVTIKADTTEVSEHTIVQLTVTGVAGMTINVKADPSSANAYFPAGLDDNPMDKTTNNFNDTIDDDGMRTYAIEFNDTGSYTIKVTDLDTDTYDSVDITVVEKEVIFDVPGTVVIGERFTIEGTANTGDTVTIAVDDEVVQKLDAIVIDENGEFEQEIDTSSADAPSAFQIPGSVRLKAYIDRDEGNGDIGTKEKDDGSVVILMVSPIHIISGNYTTLWNESLVANFTYAEIVPDIEGDGNPDVLVHTRRYDPATNTETRSVIAKKGSDGTQLWAEMTNASGENNCDLFAFPVGDLDGDGLDDVIIIKEKKDLTEKAEKIIAKKGSDGTFFWEETVNASGSGYCNIYAYCAGDLDGDGLNDVIVIKSQSDWVAGTDREEILVKKGKEGTLLWNRSLSGITCDIGVYCAGDLDGDGLDDVILSEWQQGADTSTAKIVANKGKDGTLIWDELVGTREYFTYDWADCPGDLDGDGVDDVIVTEWYYNESSDTEMAKVIVKRGTNGTHLWEHAVTVSEDWTCDIETYCACDLDGDSLADVIITESQFDEVTESETKKVIVKKGIDGTLLWEKTVNGTDMSSILAYCSCDLDGDGMDDVILNERDYNESLDTETAKLTAKKGTDGTPLWNQSVTINGTYNCFFWSHCTEDMDGDGMDDIIVEEFLYNEATDIETERVIAKKGIDGSQLWVESINGTACYIRAYLTCDLDGDSLVDVVVTEWANKSTGTEMAKAIAKKGTDGTALWTESVNGTECHIEAYLAGDLDGDGLEDVIVNDWKYNNSTSMKEAKAIAKKGKNGKPLIEAQSNESIWVPMWWWGGYDLNGDGKNDTLWGISTELLALTYIHGAVNQTPVAAFSYSPANP
ncbi:hypothetical protein C5S31_03415, partial [ANME-1 cluster archaeon GoMg2]|nr:hypothetical protein [ANME-1 cluster archaeon GoMg2]